MGQTDALTSILTLLDWRARPNFGEPEYMIFSQIYTQTLRGRLGAGDTPRTELCYK